jgi:hypothetical protein
MPPLSEGSRRPARRQHHPQDGFQIGSTLATAAGSSMVFPNGANPHSDVFWLVGSSATIGANTVFGGSILVDQGATVGTGATVEGRVIALHAAVTLADHTITVPEPSSALLGIAGAASLFLLRRRRPGAVVR